MAEGLGGSIRGRKKEQQLLVHQPESKALRLTKYCSPDFTMREPLLHSVLGEAPAVLMCG